MAFIDGLSNFLSTWTGVHTAYSFNNTNANTGTDTTHDANSSTYSTATGYPNYALAAACNPDNSGSLDIYIVTDACMLLYIPAGLTHDQVYGLFHNGGGTHAQAGFLRATTTGVEICCTHNAGGTPQDNVIHEIPDAQLPGWFAVGFQFASEGGDQGDMGLWINGVKVRNGTRGTQLQYGAGNPQIGDSNADHPLEASCLDPSDYSGGNWGAEATINSSGILIANFVADNPNNDNSSPDGCGDSFYTDYYDEHLAATADECTADSITSGIPTLGTPTAARIPNLTANAITSGTPTLGTPTLGQEHALTADSITSSAPTLGTPTAAHIHDLTADGITASAPTLGTPAVGQEHALVADGITASAPTLGTPTASVIHNLLAENIATGSPVVDSAILGQVHVLLSDAITSGTPVLGTPTAAQIHNLSADGITAGAPTLGTPSVGLAHNLVANGITAGGSTGTAIKISGSGELYLSSGSMVFRL